MRPVIGTTHRHSDDMNASQLTRRERQIVDILYRLGEATAADVQAELPDPPSYSAVRAQLRLLVQKGLATHYEDGPRYVYQPAVAPEKARETALRHLLKTFFGGSPTQAVAALLDDHPLSEEEYERLAGLIEQARDEGR